MCIIIANKDAERVPDDIILRSVKINPHGFGIVFLDTKEVIKTMDMKKAAILLQEERPFIAHCRLATKGDVTEENIHPYKLGNERWVFMNGTLDKIECKDGESDTAAFTRALASGFGKKKDLFEHEEALKTILEQNICRWAVTDGHDFRLFNLDKWKKDPLSKDNILYSKDNVLEGNIVAMYGMAKKGFRLHASQCTGKTFLGEGYLEDALLCVSDKGVPTLLSATDKKKGKRVKVELYNFTDYELNRISVTNSKKETRWVECDGVDVEATVFVSLNDKEFDTGEYIEEYTKEMEAKFSRSYGPSFSGASSNTQRHGRNNTTRSNGGSSKNNGNFDDSSGDADINELREILDKRLSGIDWHSPLRDEIDNLLDCHEMYFTGKIEDRDFEGLIYVDKGKVYLCNNIRGRGSKIKDSLGYSLSYEVGIGSKENLILRNVDELDVYFQDETKQYKHGESTGEACPTCEKTDTIYDETIDQMYCNTCGTTVDTEALVAYRKAQKEVKRMMQQPQ